MVIKINSFLDPIKIVCFSNIFRKIVPLIVMRQTTSSFSTGYSMPSDTMSQFFRGPPMPSTAPLQIYERIASDL
jgi:hypothetical protein